MGIFLAHVFISSAAFRAKSFNQISHGGKRLAEADPFIGPRERDRIDVILIFTGPEFIRAEFVQHAGQERGRGNRRRCLHSPAHVARRGLAQEVREAAGGRDGFPERGEIVQVADDGGVVLDASPLPCMHTPGKGAEFVGRGFDRIHTEERWNLRRFPLRHADQRTNRPRGRRQRRGRERHLDPQMRTQAWPRDKQARVKQIDREELAFIALHRLAIERETRLRQSGQDTLAIIAPLVSALLRLTAAGIATLKSMSSEKRLIRPQPFDSDVPPPNAGAAAP